MLTANISENLSEPLLRQAFKQKEPLAGVEQLGDAEPLAAAYPRAGGHDEATVTHYRDALDGGAQFPPIKLEPETNRQWDGRHRTLAYRAAGRAEIPFEYVACPDGVPPLLFAAQLNSQHGHGLSNDDRREIRDTRYEIRDARCEMRDARCEMRDARRMYEDGANQEQVGAALGVSQQSVSNWTADLQKRDHARDVAAARLLRHVGLTHERIAEIIGASKTSVVRFISTNKSDLDEDAMWWAANACAAHLGDDPNTIVDAVLFADEEVAAEAKLRELAAGGNAAAAEAFNNATLPHYRTQLAACQQIDREEAKRERQEAG